VFNIKCAHACFGALLIVLSADAYAQGLSSSGVVGNGEQVVSTPRIAPRSISFPSTSRYQSPMSLMFGEIEIAA
jgi:hypothetical protein